jgi:hypothetical protein
MKRVENNVEWQTDDNRTLLKLENASNKLTTPVCGISFEEIPDFIQALTEAREMMRKNDHAAQ